MNAYIRDAMIAKEQARLQEIEKQAVEANLRALQAQIEPHFLFNTLANVTGLIHTDPDKAKQMLEMFPRLAEEGQVEVAQHLANLVADENYAPLAKFLTDTQLPESVLDVLMADVLNRPNSLKLPALLEVAKDDKNPKAPEAKDLLELFLEENYGSDWGQWQTKMNQWLKDNPD